MSAQKILKTIPQLGECRRLLESRYRDRLASLCVFGSRARGNVGEDSDLDLLVLLRGDFDYFEELREIIEVLDGIQQESPFLISARPARLSDFEEGTIQLYRNAKTDGVLL